MAHEPESTTALGDWFAQPVAIGHQRYVLLVSARSLLPILIRARDFKRFDEVFPDALASVLRRIGVPHADVARELAESREVIVAATNSRSVLGSVNDFAKMMKWALPDDPEINLTETALWLGDSPCKPLGYGIPLETAFDLLTQRHA